MRLPWANGLLRYIDTHITDKGEDGKVVGYVSGLRLNEDTVRRWNAERG